MANVDVKSLFDSTKALIKTINSANAKNQKVSEDLFKGLSNSYSTLVEYAKFYLINAQDKLYGTIFMNLDIDINYKQNGSFDIKPEKTPIIFGINPLYCGEYSFQEFIGCIVNEIIKLIYLHPTLYGKLNPTNKDGDHNILEAASSASSTEIVRNDIRLSKSAGRTGLQLPQDVLTTPKLDHELNIRTQPKSSLEYYYKVIKNFDKDNNIANGEMNGQGQGGINAQGQGQSSGDQNGQGDGNSTGVSSPENPINSTKNNCHNWENVDEDEAKSKITTLVTNAYNALPDESKGSVPGGILQQIKSLSEPPQIPWDKKLSKLFGTVPADYRPTRTRLDRRQPWRTDLPGKIRDYTIRIVVGIDTSGSVSDGMLEIIFNEMFGILKGQKYEITVVETDAQVNRVYKVNTINDLKHKIENEGVSGRGGTWFQPTIDYVNGEGDFKNNKKFPDAGKYKDAFFIYFTDGFGEAEITKPKTYKNLWVVFEDVKNLSVKEPYGDVAVLDFKRYHRL